MIYLTLLFMRGQSRPAHAAAAALSQLLGRSPLAPLSRAGQV